MSSYRELMEKLRQAGQSFHREWRDWQEGKLSHREKLRLKGLEPENVTLARNKFYEALNLLYDTKLNPLDTKSQTNPPSAVDEIIEFLSVDVLAHRCGYAKEFLLTKLKSVELSLEQKLNLQQISITFCEVNNFHREFRRWCRLAIKIADENFLRELKNLSESSNEYAVIKSKWMIETLIRHRKDLAKAFINFTK